MEPNVSNQLVVPDRRLQRKDCVPTALISKLEVKTNYLALKKRVVLVSLSILMLHALNVDHTKLHQKTRKLVLIKLVYPTKLS